MLVTNGLGILVFAFGSVFVALRDDLTGSAVLTGLALLSAYALFGYYRAVRIRSDDEGIIMQERSVVAPFSKPSVEKIPFKAIRRFEIEQGPRSDLGPQVEGETVAVLITDAGEKRIYSRWLTDAARRELYDLLRSKVP